MKFSNVRDGTIDIVRKHRGGFSDKHTFTHQGEGGFMPMCTWVNLKVRTLIGRGGSPRKRMFAYKGGRVKTSENSAHAPCGWPQWVVT